MSSTTMSSERLLRINVEVNDLHSSKGKCNTTITISDQAQDQLEALLIQECNHYRCVDYITERKQDDASICSSSRSSIQQSDKNPEHRLLSSSSSSSSATINKNTADVVSIEKDTIIRMTMPNTPDLIHMLEECAFLVTDMRYMEDQSSSSSSSTRQEAASSSSSSSSAAPGTPLMKRVGSVVSFKGIHEEAEASHHQHQQQHQQQQEQQQQQPSGEDLAYWRRQMMEWAFLVVKSFEMDREVVAVAFNLLDRYVPLEMSRDVSNSTTVTMLPPITRHDYQLYAMTCLYTAVKICEPYPRKLAIEALVAMSRDFYTAHDVSYTELDILKVLQWHVNPPTAMTFARHFVDALLAVSCSAAAPPIEAAPSCCSTKNTTMSPSSVINRAFAQREQEDACSINHGALPFLHQKENDDLYAQCAKITEMALVDPFFLSFHNSTVGLAAVLHAVRLQGRSNTCTSVVAASSSWRCKALLKALQRAKIMSTTTSATSATATAVGEEHVKKNQISGSELEVVYSRLEKLILSS